MGIRTTHSLATTCVGLENAQGSPVFSLNLASANSFTPGATSASVVMNWGTPDIITTKVAKFKVVCDTLCLNQGVASDTPPPPDIPPTPTISNDTPILTVNFSFGNGNYVPLLGVSDSNPTPYSCSAFLSQSEIGNANISSGITINQSTGTGVLTVPYSSVKNISSGGVAVNFLCNHPMASMSFYTSGGGQALIRSANFSLAGEIHATKIVPVQVVSSPRLDMSQNTVSDFVVGKSASFKVYLNGSNIEQSEGTIRVKVLDSNNNLIMVSNDIDIKSVVSVLNDSKNKSGDFPVFAARFGTPGHAGVSWVVPPVQAGENPMMAFRVKVETDGASNISAKPFNDPVSYAKVVRHEVKPQKIGFIPFYANSAINCITPKNGQECHSPSNSNIATLLQTKNFFSDVFPVPDNSTSYFLNPVYTTSADPENASTDRERTSVWVKDMLKLEVIRQVMGFDRLLGVTTNAYFTSQKSPNNPHATTGLSSDYAKVGMVLERSVLSVPHELGHTYGISSEFYCDGRNLRKECINSLTGEPYDDRRPIDVVVKGFDALNRKAYVVPFPDLNEPSNQNEIYGPSIMGLAVKSDVATMAELYNSVDNSFTHWIDDESYSVILNKLVKPPPGDPEVLLVSGIVNINGAVAFNSSIDLANGTLTESNPQGDIRISSLDSDGNIIDSVNVKSGFTKISEYPAGDVGDTFVEDTDATPFVVTLPVNSRISALQVAKNNVVLSTTTLTSQELSGLISRIPDYAFRTPKIPVGNKNFNENSWSARFVADERKSLGRQVSSIQKILDSKHPKKAEIAFQLLKEEIKLVTYRDYQVLDAFSISQSQVISELDRIIKDLDGEERECQRHNWKWWR